MFPALVRRLAQTSSRQLSTTTINPSKLKKVWPPDFAKLSPQEQLKFEKKYKRRVQLATARPRWNKFIKLSQLSVITFVIVYSVLFMDWKTEHQPFDEVRKRFWGLFSAFSPEQRFERRKDDFPGSTTSSK